MKDVPFVVCSRVMDLKEPFYKSTQDKCCKCQENLWVASTTPKESNKICGLCVVKMPEVAQVKITEVQRKELLEDGFTDAQIDDFFSKSPEEIRSIINSFHKKRGLS